MSSTEPQGIYVDIAYNRYLAEGQSTVDAIVSIARRSRADEPVTSLALQVWTPVGAVVGTLKQVAPTVEDLTGRRTDAGAQIGAYPLPPLGVQDLDYHLRIEELVDPGREKMAARVMVVAGAEELARGRIPVAWTEDAARAARIDQRVAEFTGRVEVERAIDEGLAARERGDDVAAAAALQRAVELAIEVGDDETVRRLAALLEVDSPDGTARLRRDAPATDALDAPSTRTARVRREP